MSSNEPLGDRGRALESKFFHDREAEQIERLKSERAKDHAVTELSEITGMKDQAVLRKMVDLGVTPMTLTAFSIVPMLHVAWSDRVLDTAERKSILLEATGAGLKSTSPGYHLLESWLTERPNPELFQAWRDFHTELSPHLSADEKTRLREEMLAKAEKVARASGGILGFASVSSEERQALSELQQILS